MRIARYALVALVLAGCGQPMESDAPVQREALASDGVPQNGFPNWAERTVLVLTNRMRADPQAALTCSSTECPDKPCYQPVPPVMWSYDLNRSSRFHAANLIKSGSDLQHPSPCTLKTNIASLYPTNCDGSQSCACASNTCSSQCNCPQGTDPFVRMAYFFPTVRNGQYGCAENIAAGYGDPVQAMDGWVNETCVNSPYICSASQCSGNSSHRYNIFNRRNVWMGSGAVVASGNYCNYGGTWWGQDFGCTNATLPAIPKLVAGSHFPQSGSAPTFYANWYSTSGAPTSAQVNIDGACHAMSRDRGSAGNATYAWTASGLSSTCQRYVFVFTDAQGTVTLPGSGAYMVGSGCADWDATAPPPCGSGTAGSTSAGTTASSTGGASTSSSSSSGASSSSSSSSATSAGNGTSSSSTTAGATTGGATSAGSTTAGASSSGDGSSGSSGDASGAGAAGGSSGGSDSSVDGGCSSTGGADLLALAPLFAMLGWRRERRV